MKKNNLSNIKRGSYLIYMCPRSYQNPEYDSKLVHTFPPKCNDIAISLNFNIVGSGALGTLCRRFKSCRPYQL